MKIQNESYNIGFHRGNYGNAYETEDWQEFYEKNQDKVAKAKDPEAFFNGMLLGFFSTYEIHEIGDSELAEQVSYLRSEYGEEA